MPSDVTNAPYVPRRGDKVTTLDGAGFVTIVLRWNHVVVEMGEIEARSFGKAKLAVIGVEWRTIWFRAGVMVNGSLGWYENGEIQALQ